MITGIEFQSQNQETDPQIINHEFETKPDNEILLLASHLTRPNAFTKILITGTLTSSSYLIEKFGDRFVRTHRGYYKTFPSSYTHGANKDISFRLGNGQALYNFSEHQNAKRWTKGLGFTIPEPTISSISGYVTEYAGINQMKVFRDRIKKSSPLSLIEQKILALDDDQLRKFGTNPPAEDFNNFINLARRYRFLDEAKDQAEVKLLPPSPNKPPKVDLKQAIILIPSQSQEAIVRLLDIKLKEIAKHKDQIIEHSGVDITKMTGSKIISQYQNIYWYPQENIGLAIKYLSAHPEKVKNILSKS